MAVCKINFLSKKLGMQTNITICIPTYNFNDSMKQLNTVYLPGMKYQVLYLLHGGSGDDSDYVNYTNIVRYADENKVFVVMPNDYNACYTDYDNTAYYSFITQELPLFLRTMFPISTKKEDTFIGGLSMGSHGAMKVAVNHPERFHAALIMSGAATRPNVPTMVPVKNGVFDFDAPPVKIPLGKIAKLIEDPEYIKGTANDVYTIARQKASEFRDSAEKLPEFFFRVGDCDHALYRAELANTDLQNWGYTTHFEIVPGMGHEWNLWDDTLRKALYEWMPFKRHILYPEKEI